MTADAAPTITPKSPSKVSGCYQISSAAELYGFASIVNGTDGFVKDSAACGKLTKDIVVNEKVLTTLGTLNTTDTANFARWIPMEYFCGSFDGQGHTISGLYFDNDTVTYVGLFGVIVSPSAHLVEIKNLGVVGSFFRGNLDVGSIAGILAGYSPMKVENVFTDSRVEGISGVGGLTGMVLDSVYIKDCYNLGAVVGDTHVGGISGYMVGAVSSLQNVYNGGTVKGRGESLEYTYVGGLAGYVTGKLYAENCYNRGSVFGKDLTGGLFGYVSNRSDIVKCYNTGDISGEYVVGGIVGELMEAEYFTNVYNLGRVSGMYDVGGIFGSLGKANNIVNVYNAGLITPNADNTATVGSIAGYLSYNVSAYPFDNVFSLQRMSSMDLGAVVSEEMMSDGTIAYLLHNYSYDGVDASVWGQKVGVDPFPNFSGVVTNISSDAFVDLILHTFDGDTVTLPEKYLPGYKMLLPKPTYKNKLFLDWYDNAEFDGDPVKIIPATATGTQEFWGRIIDGYSITYETNGGTLDDAAVKVYIQGDSVTLLDPEPRLGYIFRGWYESEDFSGKRIRAIGTKETGDKTFYARWLMKTPPSLDENGCYVISDASELYGFAAIVNGTDGFMQKTDACGKLANDIVVNENVLTKNGILNMADTADFVKWAPIMQFGGTFDGQGHTISGLYLNDDLVDRVGLFGSAIDAEIKNVGVEGSFFRGDDEIGAVVGASVGTLMLDNVYSASRVEGAYSSVGGIVGVATGTGTLNIRNSYNLGAVVGKSNVGGLVGYTYVDTTTFVNVYNMGSVTCINGYSSYSEAGGIVGHSSTRLQIQNAYNVGSVYGQNYIGGIAGTSSGYNVLVNVYNAGAVSSLEEIEYCVGPIAGYAYKSSSDIFENVFYLDVEQGSKYGDAVTDEMVKDGSLAYLLHNYFHSGVDGSIWGQDVEKDDYPNFSGVITEFPSDLFEDLVLHTFEGDTVTLPQKYLPGYAMRLPEPVYEGKMFVGWYESDGFDGNPVELIPATATGTQEFWGKYNDMYRVTLETNGGTVDSLDVASYVAGIGCDLPNKVSRKGYIFRGWYESEDFDGDRAFQVGTDASGDKTFYAKWFKIETPSKDDEGCYVIKNASELYGFAALVNGTPGHSGETEACASLDSDIVVNENVIDQDGNINEADSVGFMQWTPINGFSGKFDGKGHVVRGLYFNESTMPSECDDENGCGFFGWLGENSQNDTIVIENLGIEGSYFAYHDYILGALVGAVQGSLYSNSVAYVRISNCYSTSTVVSDGYVGAIVGKTSRNTSTVIENCYNTGKIVARDYAAGGLVGLAYYGVDLKVLNSYNTGTIMVEGRQKPGVSLIGYDYIIADVENSYYLKVADSVEYYGYAVTSEQFENGVVATALHGGENGSIWGQNVGKDPLPNFSGKVKNSAAVQYKVTFHTFDGDTASFFKKYVAGLPKQLPKKPVRNGYRFSGWYVDSTFAGKPVTSINETDSGDLDFYAYWVANWYTVRVYSGLGGTVAGLNPSGSYTYGDTVDLEAQPYEGYRFSYWGDNLDSANAKRQVVIVSDTTFSVYFAKASSSSVSSSSAKSSSSSAKAKSSSSSAGSSSSKKAKSSSSKGTKSSSSCSGDKCGKDLPIVFELVCNGKKCSNALSAKVAVPQFRVVVVGRDIQVMEARVGSPYALFDLQGGLVRSGQVGSVDFTIPAPHSGSYLVRIGNRIKRVTVR